MTIGPCLLYSVLPPQVGFHIHLDLVTIGIPDFSNPSLDFGAFGLSVSSGNRERASTPRWEREDNIVVVFYGVL